MIIHTALFRFSDGVTHDQRARWVELLDRLPDEIDLLLRFRHGGDLSIVDGTWDYAVVAEFAAPEHYPQYSVHPVHQEFVSFARPLMAESARVQFET